MPHGESIILKQGEGSLSWDSTAYNMILVNETERFLDEHIQNRIEDPFFAYVALGNVHIPHSPPISFLDGSPIAGEYPTKQMDILLEMDKIMGHIIQLLKERNLEDDTIIIFTSDNGGLGRKYSFDYGHNSHGPFKGAKGSIYEGGHRIPLIMKWKNGAVPSGETRSQLIGLNDLYATICGLADVEIPDGQAIDSVSYANYIANETLQNDLREYLGTWTVKSGRIFEESIRKDNLKLIRNRHNESVSLFDLDNDVSESTSLASISSHKNVIAEMLKKLEEISPCYDDEGTFFIETSRGKLVERSCEWFAEKPSRCAGQFEGKIHCRLTCAGWRNARSCSLFPPTVAPTPKPTPHHFLQPSSEPSLIQSIDPTQITSTSPSVVPSLLQSNVPTYRPSQSPTYIPITECKDSEAFTFGIWEWNQNEKNRTCDWLTHDTNPITTEGRISKWCDKTYNGYLIKDYCPLTCRICEYPSSMPSRKPSLQPSIHQSGHPSILPTVYFSNVPSKLSSSFPTENPSTAPSFIPITECEDSSGFTFGMSSSNGRTRTCQWLTHPMNPSITDNRISKWCDRIVNKFLVKDYCRLSCRVCDFPSIIPSMRPSLSPTRRLSVGPTAVPSTVSSFLPSNSPSRRPTSMPSVAPTVIHSATPSIHQSEGPTSMPSSVPSTTPSKNPTSIPSIIHSSSPSALQSEGPTSMSSSVPSTTPSKEPTSKPSLIPSVVPSERPTATPFFATTVIPTSASSSMFPSKEPTSHPSSVSSATLSVHQKSEGPTSMTSLTPSVSASMYPSKRPTSMPSVIPSATPSVHPSYGLTAMTSLNSSVSSSMSPSKKESTSNPTFTISTIPILSISTSPSFQPSERPTIKSSENSIND